MISDPFQVQLDSRLLMGLVASDVLRQSQELERLPLQISIVSSDLEEWDDLQVLSVLKLCAQKSQ